MDDTRWDGVTLRSTLNPQAAAGRDQLADAARDGDWRTMLRILDDDPIWTNSARFEGRSLYTPLHQAAWHGAPTETVERLLAYGAWRTLRTSAGKRPVDIAEERGHHHLTRILRPVVKHPVPPDVLASLQRNLHALIRHVADPRDGRGDLATREQLRLPELEVLTELDRPACWFPVPGMYGGFSIELRGFELVVGSLVRVVEGSQQEHRVTADGVYLKINLASDNYDPNGPTPEAGDVEWITSRDQVTPEVTAKLEAHRDQQRGAGRLLIQQEQARTGDAQSMTDETPRSSRSEVLHALEHYTSGTWLELNGLSYEDLAVVLDHPRAAQVTTLILREYTSAHLPDSIGNLTSLEHLHLGQNGLAVMPDSIGNLTRLKSLDLAWNRLAEMPDSIGNLTNLERLQLEENRLAEMPDSIGNLISLEWLDLTENRLTAVPDSIGNLTNLKDLRLVGNKLTSVPDSIGNLTSLTHLVLEENKLAEVPDSIGNLTNLLHIYLRSNRLTSVPDSIGDLPRMQRLSVDPELEATAPVLRRFEK